MHGVRHQMLFRIVNVRSEYDADLQRCTRLDVLLKIHLCKSMWSPKKKSAHFHFSTCCPTSTPLPLRNCGVQLHLSSFISDSVRVCSPLVLVSSSFSKCYKFNCKFLFITYTSVHSMICSEVLTRLFVKEVRRQNANRKE